MDNMKIFQFLILGFGLLHSALSSPIEARIPPSRECSVVNEIVLALKLAGATPFCSSFLSIPVATSVSTILTSATVVETTSPLTVSTTTDYTSTETDVASTTATTATFVTVVTTDVIVTTATDVVTSTSTLFTNLGRRAVQQERHIQLPSFLQKFASSAISTACSCLTIPQSTLQTTTTTVSTIPATATSSATEIISAVTTTDTTTIIPTDLVVPTSAFTTVVVLTTEIVGAVATDCPQAVQDPGFEGAKNPPQWQATSDVNEGTFNEVYSDVPSYVHSGLNCYIFTYLNDPFDGSMIFSLSQTTTICPHQQLTLGFWLRWDTFNFEDTCNLQLCIDTQCQIFGVSQGSSSHDNQYLHYSFLAPVPNGSTSMTFSVSADGASHGSCTGNILYFDDFTLE